MSIHYHIFLTTYICAHIFSLLYFIMDGLFVSLSQTNHLCTRSIQSHPPNDLSPVILFIFCIKFSWIFSICIYYYFFCCFFFKDTILPYSIFPFQPLFYFYFSFTVKTPEKLSIFTMSNLTPPTLSQTHSNKASISTIYQKQLLFRSTKHLPQKLTSGHFHISVKPH